MMSNTTQPQPFPEPSLALVLESIQSQLQTLHLQLGTQYDTLTTAISKVQEESMRRLEALETAAPQQLGGLVPGAKSTPFILTPQGSATPEPEAPAEGGSNTATKRKPLP